MGRPRRCARMMLRPCLCLHLAARWPLAAAALHPSANSRKLCVPQQRMALLHLLVSGRLPLIYAHHPS